MMDMKQTRQKISGNNQKHVALMKELGVAEAAIKLIKFLNRFSYFFISVQ